MSEHVVWFIGGLGVGFLYGFATAFGVEEYVLVGYIGYSVGVFLSTDEGGEAFSDFGHVATSWLGLAIGGVAGYVLGKELRYGPEGPKNE